ncbi:MAG: hypothetical protein PHU44_07535 [Syntrophales bacterium]|nr:hypothetical protein [Syntrophales bacterium]MDD5643476.1 hypothetical protein [Syntrophales bacterium]
METKTIEILKLVASFLTPLVIVIIGIIIQRHLEKIKIAFAKEKDWQSWWASKLLNVADEYNTSVSELVTSCYQLVQINDQKLSGWEDEDKILSDKIKQIIYKMQFLNWEIKNYIQFAKKCRSLVEDKENTLYGLLKSLLTKKQGNLEEIRKAQFEFNEAVRLAHAELLTISLDASLKTTTLN